MQDNVTICNDADGKKKKKKKIDWLYFLLQLPPNVTLSSYLF